MQESLVNILRPILQAQISPFQAAFLRSRWIVENTLCSEVTDTITKNKKEIEKKRIGKGGLMCLKLDMQKAYNGVVK